MSGPLTSYIKRMSYPNQGIYHLSTLLLLYYLYYAETDLDIKVTFVGIPLDPYHHHKTSTTLNLLNVELVF